ncbi:MAG: glutamine-hydrolyzing carbamoyl-phosphate synthase small subunit [Clostridia bacterium]|nr:glutamine-hydrolyzing carbamoyl-phosphate synthase small subunit [Clostridia bacterium]MBQ9108597.1 glutamine-hydrolyzing carbamoyl-phosphate synthase small subunit [Oscillospiraceae bacterium]
MDKKGYLLLSDGTLYEGVLRGAYKDAAAEVVFLTSVVGYMDTLTDPAYEGQIVVQTFPQIGNYGVVPLERANAKPQVSGYICRELCEEPSNFRCQGKLGDYLSQNGIPCLTDIDTRALTRRLRDKGVMNGAILTEKPENVAEAAAKLAAQSFKPDMAKATVPQIISAEKSGTNNVVLWDLGAMGDTLQQLESRGCAVTIVPAFTSADKIMSYAPDGVVITGGAGNPEDYTAIAGEIAQVCKKHVPVMGIGLGHQLLAISQGAATAKLPFGHRGGNQPIEDVKTGNCYVTSQNHGYEVDKSALPANASLRFVNRNDGSCEGIDYMDMPAFSVQFQPAACGGPLDTRFLYDRFIALMGGNKECR